MRKILLLGATALALSGCAAVNSFENWVTSPKTQATFATLESQATVVICDVSAVSSLASVIESEVNAGQSTQGTTGKIYAVSTTVCVALGGVYKGTTTVPAGTTVAQ